MSEMGIRVLRCIRHGRSAANYAHGRFLGTDRMNAALDSYDEAGIARPERVLVPIAADASVISSDAPRAVETAAAVTGRPSETIHKVPLFREVPLPRFKSRFLYLPPGAFLALGRAGWALGCLEASETSSETKARVRQAIAYLDRKFTTHVEIVLFSHCFFMRCLQWQLSKRGWSSASLRPFGFFEERTIRSDGAKMVSRKVAS
ncbi:histidine phosphatase family protein [Labrenzia sp. OB1]|uniref:histidine phosphatase family protein n=1 Tax=Labrenzia sp. OB1 TaxID=1561204 RepID=UPI0009ED46B7